MPRATPGGLIYHVLNRANAGLKICRGQNDYAAFERAFEEAHAKVPVRVLAYCLMPDHWHLVLWPRKEHDLSEFMRWLTVTHTRRWHAQHDSAGTGHLYQGRYRSFPVEPGEPLLTVCRYVESNARRDGQVRRAENWPWTSLWRRQHGAGPGQIKLARGGKDAQVEEPHGDGGRAMAALLDDGPMPLPRNWVARVNEPFTDAELAALRTSVRRGTPFGSTEWKLKVAKRLGLEYTMRPRGRPRKAPLLGAGDATSAGAAEKTSRNGSTRKGTIASRAKSAISSGRGR